MASVPVSVERERYVYRFGGGVSDGGNVAVNLIVEVIMGAIVLVGGMFGVTMIDA